MEAFGLGELRLSPKRFWRLSWRDYGVLAGAYHYKQVQKWQHTRYLAALLINLNRSSDTPAITPQELMSLPGDPPPPPPMSVEEYEAEFARVAQLDSDLVP